MPATGAWRNLTANAGPRRGTRRNAGERRGRRVNFPRFHAIVISAIFGEEGEMTSVETGDRQRMQLQPVGVIWSTLKERRGAPRQGPEGAPDAWLDIDPAFA